PTANDRNATAGPAPLPCRRGARVAPWREAQVQRGRAVPEARHHRPSLGGRDLAAPPELGGDRAQGGDHEGDVLVEVDAQLLGTLDDLVAVHAAGEARLLQLLAHRLRLEGRDSGGPCEAARQPQTPHLLARA